MNIEDYITRSLSKIKHKRWEVFIISRIIHGLCKDHLDVEFSCQQLVQRKNGQRALTDMYFPELKVHLEIDEIHHERNYDRENDQNRDRDIINQTNDRIIRIKTHQGKKQKNLNTIIKEVDDFLENLIKQKISMLKKGAWKGWNFGERFDPKTYQKLGHLHVQMGPVFRTHKRVLECFGYCGGNYQRATWTIPTDPRRIIWFPKLYDNSGWENNLSLDGEIITEKPVSEEMQRKHGNREIDNIIRVVFAHYKDALGGILYRYLGEFQASGTCENGMLIYDRKSEYTDLSCFR